jgi:la-related protein 1
MYCYLSNSLRDTFDYTIYERFRENAIGDAARGKMYGVQCLFRFYSYGLEKRFDSRVFEDFQTCVIMDCESGYSYGVEKLWAYLMYSKSKAELRPDVKRHLMHWLV